MTLRSVLVTRPAGEMEDLRAALEGAGFAVTPLATLRHVDVEDVAGWRALSTAPAPPARVAFTSSRAPGALRRAAGSRALPWRLLDVPAAAVGGATGDAAVAAGFSVAEVGTAGGADLAARVAAALGRGSVVLHACSRERHPDLAGALAAAGIETVPVVVYATEAVAPGELAPRIAAARPDAVLLTSPRAAEAYVAAAGSGRPGVPHLAIGPTTAARARELGLDAVPLPRPTPAAALEVLCRICP